MPYLIYDCGCRFEILDPSIKEDVYVKNVLDDIPSIKIDYDDLPKQCGKTYDLLTNGDTIGVFQLESRLGHMWAKRSQPKNINEISDLVAGIRPGLLDNIVDGKNLLQHYCDRKHGVEEVTYWNDTLKQILESTQGILCIDSDTYVSMADGTEKQIKYIQRGDYLSTVNQQTKKIEFKPCIDIIQSRQGQGVELLLHNGFRIILTDDHEVLTQRGSVQVKDLDIDKDLIQISLSSPHISDIQYIKQQVGDIGYSKIKQITPIKDKIYYSISVADNHNLIGNGIVIKNCYQEQAIQLANKVAGFNLQESDILRRAIGHKDTNLMSKLETSFIEGCKKTGIVNEEQARELFETIRASQRYTFNKCFCGNTLLLRDVITKARPLTIKEMYYIRNDISYAKSINKLPMYKKWKFYNSYCNGYSMYPDGRVRTNIIKDIYYAGIQDVYRVTTEDQQQIVCTINHKFPTQRGELPLSQISVGDYLFIKDKYEKTSTKKYNYSDYTKEDRKYLQDNHSDEKHMWYTNGSFTDYMTNKEILPQVCQQCGKQNCRIETHHINGDRNDSSLANLINLCVSCHKKAHYRTLNRRKMGEKGYPTYQSKIISIEYAGKEEVFDVEMEGPHHNVVIDNGIVTCNSHAVAYALTGYSTAFCKAHFPLQFYTAYLRGSIWQQKPLEEIKILVNDARKHNISVLPPDLRNLQEEFFISNKKIYCGLATVRNCGKSALNSINTAIRETADVLKTSVEKWRWIDLLLIFFPKLGISLCEALIKCGACDYLGISRNQMWFELGLFNTLTKGEAAWVLSNLWKYQWTTLEEVLIECGRSKKDGGGCHSPKRVDYIQKMMETLKNPPHSLEDSVLMRVQGEEQYLGVALTATKIDGKMDAAQATHSIKEFLDGADKSGTLAVEITELKVVKTKKGNNPGQEMSFLVIQDSSSSLEGCVCFPNVYTEYGDLIYVGNTLLAQVEKNKQQDGYIINKLWQI